MDWITQNWPLVLGVIYAFLSAAGQLTGMFDGPKAEKAQGIFERILAILRGLGIGTYKDEPGSVSMPFKGDTGKRV
jgi:hypothetical protein